MNKVRLFPLGVIAVALCGCINTTESLFSQSNTKIATTFWNSDTAQIIQVGSVADPYTGDPTLKIKINDTILFDSLTSVPDELITQNETRNAARFTGMGEYPSSKTLRSEQSWGQGAVEVDLLVPSNRDPKLCYDEARRQGVSVIVQNNKIRAIRIADLRYDPKNNMIELKFGHSRWVNSRLTHPECIELFGEPIAERSYFTE